MELEPVDVTSITDRMVLDYTFAYTPAPENYTAEQIAEWKQTLIDSGAFANWKNWSHGIEDSPAFNAVLAAGGEPNTTLLSLLLKVARWCDRANPPAHLIVPTWRRALDGAQAAGLVFPSDAIADYNAHCRAQAVDLSLLLPEITE